MTISFLIFPLAFEWSLNSAPSSSMFIISWFGNILQLTLSAPSMQISLLTIHRAYFSPFALTLVIFFICINSSLLSTSYHEIPSNISYTSSVSLCWILTWVLLDNPISNYLMEWDVHGVFFKEKIYWVPATFPGIRLFLFFKKGYAYVGDKQTEILSSLISESLFLTHENLVIDLPCGDSVVQCSHLIAPPS